MIEKSADFTSRPEVLASYEKDNHSEPDFVSDDAKPGDTFILVTDALAKWTLEHEKLERREEALRQLKQIQTDNQFQEFVDSSRELTRTSPLVNDDVTLMIISVEKDDALKRVIKRLQNVHQLKHPNYSSGMATNFIAGR